jgi:hypothetical protein
LQPVVTHRRRLAVTDQGTVGCHKPRDSWLSKTKGQCCHTPSKVGCHKPRDSWLSQTKGQLLSQTKGQLVVKDQGAVGCQRPRDTWLSLTVEGWFALLDSWSHTECRAALVGRLKPAALAAGSFMQFLWWWKQPFSSACRPPEAGAGRRRLRLGLPVTRLGWPRAAILAAGSFCGGENGRFHHHCGLGF